MGKFSMRHLGCKHALRFVDQDMRELYENRGKYGFDEFSHRMDALLDKRIIIMKDLREFEAKEGVMS